MRSATSLCPSRFCSAHNPVQSLVSKQQAEAVSESALEGAIICRGCGCVYVRDPRNNTHILGTLRLAGRTYTWKTDYKIPTQR